MSEHDGTWHHCWKCQQPFWLPRALSDAAHASDQIGVFCAYGHRGVFSAGETEVDKLRRERDRLSQQIAQRDDEIKWQRDQREQAERRLSATKGQITKIKNRVGNGVCPCCNRTFGNLARHMHSQHPDYPKAEESNVVPLKQPA